MVDMIDIEDFGDLCSKKIDAYKQEKDNEKKYLTMKNYSVESRVPSRVGLGMLSFGIGYCVCTIGQFPLSATELQLLMLGGSTAASLLGCDILEIGFRKSYKDLTAAKKWYNKINEQAFYKIEMLKGKKKYEAYSKTIKKLEEADFEFDLGFSSMTKAEREVKWLELEKEAKKAEEKVELYALEEALISEFSKKSNPMNFVLGFGCAIVGAGFFSAVVDALPSLASGPLYENYLGEGIDPIVVSAITSAMVGVYNFNKFSKHANVLKDFTSLLGEKVGFLKDKSIYTESEKAVDEMADANLSLILYKGYMKSLENCDEMNKKMIKTQEVDS